MDVLRALRPVRKGTTHELTPYTAGKADDSTSGCNMNDFEGECEHVQQSMSASVSASRQVQTCAAEHECNCKCKHKSAKMWSRPPVLAF
eukprot:1157263-Pelagomonas_calceolata.AAC.18